MSLNLHQDVSMAETGDGAVLLHQRTGCYWQLNPTGVFVLNALLDGRTDEQAADELAARHQLDSDAARRDVSKVVAQLRAAHLLIEAR